jgi:hypothetical protein
MSDKERAGRPIRGREARPKAVDEERDLTSISAFLPGILNGVTIAPPPRLPTLQAKHHYTTGKQIDALATISEDGSPEMGFMARMMTLCSLPRTDPGDRAQYERRNGPYKLYMIAGGGTKLPFGNLPRLLLAWICTEAVQKGERRLILGNSLAAFMQELGIKSDSGGTRGDRTRMKTQIDRLFNCHIDLVYETRAGKATTGGRLAPKTMLWWDYHKPEQDTLWQSWIELGEDLFNEIVEHPVPLDMRILKAMRRSSLGLDIYMWLSYKTYALYSRNKKPERLSWERLYEQFGSDPAKASDESTVHNFRTDFLREAKKLKLAWPSLDYGVLKGGFEVRACMPSIQPQRLGSA